jgi:plastocyanin
VAESRARSGATYHLPPMPRWIRYSLLPAAIALSAFFAVLPRTGAALTIKIVGSDRAPRFSPAITTVDPGARIGFENDTKATHTATCATCKSDAWDTGDIQPGQTVFVTIQTEGAYDYVSRYDQATGLAGRLTVGAAGSPSPSAS